MNHRTVFASEPTKGTARRAGTVFVGTVVRIPARVVTEFYAALANGDRPALDIARARWDEYDLPAEQTRVSILAAAADRSLVPTLGTPEEIECVESETGDMLKLYRIPCREAGRKLTNRRE